jgi:hypothetical protein
MYANESPGRIANVHIITSGYRKFAPNRFIICAGRARPLLEARSDGFLAILAKNTGRVSPDCGTLNSQGEGLDRGAKEHESVRFDFVTAS